MLSWIDHDPAERERMQRILALFSTSEAREELGLGSVRDSIADHLFPGTSTIQTRLRYFLFTAWIYKDLEDKTVSTAKIDGELRKAEQAVIHALRLTDDQVGMFGRRAGGDLKRLPSSVYWAGLHSWGLRRHSLSQQDYHRWLDELYVARRGASRSSEGADEVEDELTTWHPKLPPRPVGFPAQAELAITGEEAEFVVELVQQHQPDSLLAHLLLNATNPPPEDAEIWEHPAQVAFPPAARALIEHGRLFAEGMQGAALLYNLMLAELSEQPELEQSYREELDAWHEELDLAALQRWDLDDFWFAVQHPSHDVTSPTRSFVAAWLAYALQGDVADNASARGLIKQREIRLKRGRSRFTNQRALEQWGQRSGADAFNYRWPVVRGYVSELHEALA